MGYLFLIVAGWATYGIYRMLRTGRENQRYLIESREEVPLQTDHLSPAVARLVRDTRLLRISLEAPVRQIRELLIGDLDTASAEDLDAFDNMLMTVSRQLGEWLQTVDRLPEGDAAVLADQGLSGEPIRNAMIREGWSFDRKHLRGPGGPMDRRLAQIIAELQRFETLLQNTGRVYR
ncbi:hypothetical protein [Paraliomyxa miuraensis]|uniref:hypothetical protein n=1 Tax=Paraliomyxa miuraensis TaxID=376150 RepID=UPI002256EAE3|nr:hypothetical protein [Paraliomyxa miuraensis]MCX4246134.1 hypothetical protein [Paraliomyxa miuraensis]